jgi:hypothetical protein
MTPTTRSDCFRVQRDLALPSLHHVHEVHTTRNIQICNDNINAKNVCM